MLDNRFLRGCSLLALIGLALAGCGKPEEIEHYQVDKPEVIAKLFPQTDVPKAERPRASDRMLAAIVPHGDQLWFFKLAGPGEAVGGQEPAFDQFIAGLEFGDGASPPPQWKLPAGWHQQPGSDMRFATISIDSAGKPLELSVTKLSRPADKDDDAILANVNRWRGQMGLKPIAADQLADETTRVKLAAGQAVVVKLVGKLRAGGMMGAPFAGGLPPDHPQLPADHPAVGPGDSALPGDQPPVEPAEADLKFDTPAGWQPGKLNVMRKVAFIVEDGPQKVEITVTVLPPFAGDLLANVNRWRGQVHLDDVTAAELPTVAKPISVGGVAASYVQLTAPAEPKPQQTILGVMVPRGDQVWFIKLQGDAPMAERERERFEAFVKSIRF